MVHSFPFLIKIKIKKNQTNLRGRNRVGKRNIGVVLLSLRTKIRIFFSSFFLKCVLILVSIFIITEHLRVLLSPVFGATVLIGM